MLYALYRGACMMITNIYLQRSVEETLNNFFFCTNKRFYMENETQCMWFLHIHNNLGLVLL